MSNVLLTITWLLRQTIVKGHTELYPYPTNELVNYVACVCVNFRHLYIFVALGDKLICLETWSSLNVTFRI